MQRCRDLNFNFVMMVPLDSTPLVSFWLWVWLPPESLAIREDLFWLVGSATVDFFLCVTGNFWKQGMCHMQFIRSTAGLFDLFESEITLWNIFLLKEYCERPICKSKHFFSKYPPKLNFLIRNTCFYKEFLICKIHLFCYIKLYLISNKQR